MKIKPWREIITPHADVLEGTFQQSEFGGGKTHTMLAVYHMATRTGSLDDLTSIKLGNDV